MRVIRMLMMMAVLGGFTACKPSAVQSNADAGVARQLGPADKAEVSDGAYVRPGAPPNSARGGAFARESGFRLPVPVSSMPVRADTIPQSRQADPVGVRIAVMEGMEDSGRDVQVQVSSTGIVSLSGEVDSTAALQRAHYLARAQPGVVEVDYRNLRVRQR